MVSIAPLVSPSVAASASGMMRLPGGSSGAAISLGARQRVAEREIAAQVGGDRDRRACCCSRDSDGGTARSVSVAMVDIGTKRPSRGLQEDVLEIGRIVDRVGGRDQLHRVAAVVDEDVADLVAVEHGLQRLGEAGDVDAEVGGALAVDRDGQLRLRGVAGQPRLLEARVLLHLGDDLVGGVAELLVAVADDGELQAVAGAADAEAVGLHRDDAHARHLRQQAGDARR